MCLIHSFSIPLLSFLFFFYCSGDHRDLHSFPTRRSSDLSTGRRERIHPNARLHVCDLRDARLAHVERSEEHTSELQSRGHLVCRLLLEKKKKKKKTTYQQRTKKIR